MEAIRKQASKLREQVARQQQAVLKQLGHFSGGAFMVDDSELQSYQQLQNLYESTRAAKHLQRSIVRGVEGLIALSTKQMEIVRRLAESCCKYGEENRNSGSALARVALQFGMSHSSMEDESETLLEILSNQVSEPLRTMINGAPLEDARHLARQYDKLRHEVEAQAAEVMRRRLKFRDSTTPSSDSVVKLKTAEGRLDELQSATIALGREATDAMLSVEDQQQKITFHHLFKMSSTSLIMLEDMMSQVDAERAYHQTVVAILEKLHSEMMLEQEISEPSSPTSGTTQDDVDARSLPGDAKLSDSPEDSDQQKTYYIGKVIHPFDAQADGELSLSVGDYVVVRQVAPTGWSEGELNGEAGWFPSAYVEHQRSSAPSSKVLENTSRFDLSDIL